MCKIIIHKSVYFLDKQMAARPVFFALCPLARNFAVFFYKTSMKRAFISLALALFGAAAYTQEAWTVDSCMHYAVEHNHGVAQQMLSLDNSRAERTSAAGAFLPSISASIGGQYNFGRAIDPETNTYTDVSTFYNSNGIQASLPVFDGLRRWHNLQAARAGVLLGKTQVQIAQDEVAMNVYQSYMDALYYQSTVAMAMAKRESSEALLGQTRVHVEVGLKSEASVVQVEAQVAADDYEVTRQQNLFASAMLELRRAMGIIGREDAAFVLTEDEHCPRCLSGTGGACLLLDAERHKIHQAEEQLRAARSGYIPSVTAFGGISTTYFRTLGQYSRSFGRQLRDNAGQYVGVQLSIPIFSGLSSLSASRRQRNNLAIARERLLEKEEELMTLCRQSEADCRGLEKELMQMSRKVEADSLALQLTTRQYAEGMASAIDVQAMSASLLESRAAEMRCRLMLAFRRRQAAYYNGNSFINHN